MTERLVYFDVDSVLADFDTAYDARFKRKADGDVFWNLIATMPRFFLDLPLMPGAKEMWNVVPPHQRRILTAVAKKIDACDNQKRQWLKKHFDIEGEPVICVKGRENKHKYCWPGDILIDDRAENIADWIKAGGVGILYLSAAQAIADLKEALNLCPA